MCYNTTGLGGISVIDIILETIIDNLKLLPFLFLAFLFIELLEHKFSKNTNDIVRKSGKFGPLLGAILGAFPQCGFSVMATNLYVTRIISLGTLIAIYLSTSDEMLPILLSEKVELKTIVTLLGIKWIVGIIFGFIIDFIFRKKEKIEIHEICEHDHCHCEEGNILLSSIKHTINTMIFIFISTFIINFLFHNYGEEHLSKLFLNNSIFTPFLASLIGLIPNCGSSVLLTELYIGGVISLSSVIAGLLTGSGVAVLVLFKTNKDIKENIKIVSMIYFIGVLVGMFLHLIVG